MGYCNEPDKLLIVTEVVALDVEITQLLTFVCHSLYLVVIWESYWHHLNHCHSVYE